MENILPTWPELEEQTEQSKSSSPPVKSRGFSVWTEKELQAVLNSTPGHMASLRKEGELQTIVGMYRRHVVAEPPQPASKYTRTVQIETPGGEFSCWVCIIELTVFDRRVRFVGTTIRSSKSKGFRTNRVPRTSRTRMIFFL